MKIKIAVLYITSWQIHKETTNIQTKLNANTRVHKHKSLNTTKRCFHTRDSECFKIQDDEDMAALALLVEPLEEDNECGKNIFVNTCEILLRIIGEQH